MTRPGWPRLLATLSIGILCFVLMGAGSALAQSEQPEPPEGPAPIVSAEEVAGGDDFFVVGADFPEVPSHPPIGQIPPMPMPDDTGYQPMNSGSGAALTYDLATGAVYENAEADFTSFVTGEARGGGYAGADGGETEGEWPATFNNLSLIADATRALAPWRMNVKVVMRFGASYFVCSGTMRDAATVLTAGHCVNQGNGGPWADQIWIYPGWDGNDSIVPNPPAVANPYGWAQATNLASWSLWVNNGDFNYDVGIIGLDRAVGMLTGWFGWHYGGSCPGFHTTTTYNNAQYPAEGCGGGLHNGLDMYYWSGTFDSCPDTNRIRINTTGGCFNAGWGGSSGSGAYYIDGSSRFVHGIASTSNRSTSFTFQRQFQAWVEYSENTFIPTVRGAALDIEPLDVNATPTSIRIGDSTSVLNHIGANPTNNNPASRVYTFRVYLSTNTDISTADTLLSTQSYTWDYAAVSSVQVNMGNVTIPANTSPGTRWIGVIYDNATDTNTANNDSDGWDAAMVTITAPDVIMSVLNAPASAQPGQTITVANTVMNQGNASTGSFSVGLYYSADSTCTTSDTLLAARTVSLGAGGSSAANTNITIPAAAALGTRYICGIADRTGAVAESNENNNTRNDPINIFGNPDLVMTALNAPASAQVGQTVSVSNTVRNNGNAPAGAFQVGFYLSPDNVCTTGDTFLTSRALASLNPATQNAANTNVTIPAGTTPGGYFVCGIADRLNAVAESNESNNTISDPITITAVPTPTVNLKINGEDVPLVTTTGRVRLTLDMTAGPTALDHYYAIIVGGVAYWLDSTGTLGTTPVPLGTFPPVDLSDLVLLDSNLSSVPGIWGFAWFMLDGATVVSSDVILANVVP